MTVTATQLSHSPPSDVTDKPIRVVAGVLIRDGRVLMTKRLPDRDCPNLWETPGGKAHLRERLIQALRREWIEEVDIEIVEVWPVPLAIFHFGPPTVGRQIIIYFFLILEARGEPQMLEASDLGWFDAEEVKQLELPPANERFLDRLISLLLTSRQEQHPPLQETSTQGA